MSHTGFITSSKRGLSHTSIHTANELVLRQGEVVPLSHTGIHRPGNERLRHGEDIFLSLPHLTPTLAAVQRKTESVVLAALAEERHDDGGDDDEDEEAGHGAEDAGDEQLLVLRSVQLGGGSLEPPVPPVAFVCHVRHPAQAHRHVVGVLASVSRLVHRHHGEDEAAVAGGGNVARDAEHVELALPERFGRHQVAVDDVTLRQVGDVDGACHQVVGGRGHEDFVV